MVKDSPPIRTIGKHIIEVTKRFEVPSINFHHRAYFTYHEIRMAKERFFKGALINFECPFCGNVVITPKIGTKCYCFAYVTNVWEKQVLSDIVTWIEKRKFTDLV